MGIEFMWTYNTPKMTAVIHQTKAHLVVNSSHLEVLLRAVNLLVTIMARLRNKDNRVILKITERLGLINTKTLTFSLETLYGSILGIDRVGGPEPIRKLLMSNVLFKRILCEIQDQNRIRNPTSYYSLLCCLITLAQVVSRLSEGQEELQHRVIALKTKMALCISLQNYYPSENKNEFIYFRTKKTNLKIVNCEENELRIHEKTAKRPKGFFKT